MKCKTYLIVIRFGHLGHEGAESPLGIMYSLLDLLLAACQVYQTLQLHPGNGVCSDRGGNSPFRLVCGYFDF